MSLRGFRDRGFEPKHRVLGLVFIVAGVCLFFGGLVLHWWYAAGLGVGLLLAGLLILFKMRAAASRGAR